eukprot:gene14740-16278_t
MADNASRANQLDSFRQELTSSIERISLELASSPSQENIRDLIIEIDCVIQAATDLDSVSNVSDVVFQELLGARQIAENACSSSLRVEQRRDGNRGRPSYVITKEQLECLVDLGFNATQIKDLLHVSKRTIERRLAEYEITALPYSNITDDELNGIVMEIKHFNPNCGSKNLFGYLSARRIKVQCHRIRESLQRLWITGQLNNPVVDMNEAVTAEDNGVDWEGPAGVEVDNQVQIPDTRCVLKVQQLHELNVLAVDLKYSPQATAGESVQWYQFVKEYVNRHNEG